jgi:hypothetical protein
MEIIYTNVIFSKIDLEGYGSKYNLKDFLYPTLWLSVAEFGSIERYGVISDLRPNNLSAELA